MLIRPSHILLDTLKKPMMELSHKGTLRLLLPAFTFLYLDIGDLYPSHVGYVRQNQSRDVSSF